MSKAVKLFGVTLLASGIGIVVVRPAQGLWSQQRPAVVVTVPVDPTSEVVTLAIADTSTRPPTASDSLLREAVLLTSPGPAMKSLENAGPSFTCSSTLSPSREPCELTVDGVSYERVANSNRWTAMRIASSSSATLSPASEMNSLRIFGEESLQTPIEIGDANVDGVATTGYHAVLSLIKLYELGLEQGDGLASFAMTLATPGAPSRILSAPVTVFVDAAGGIVQAQSSVQTVAQGGAVERRTATVTLSNFGLAVDVKAPTAGDVTFSLLRLTRAAGEVRVESSGTVQPSGRGLLVVTQTLTLSRPGYNLRATSETGLVAVDAGGHFEMSVRATSTSPGATDRISAVFYPSVHTTFLCAAKAGQHFVMGRTVNGFDFSCSIAGR
jgi:hypothetical protein